MVKVIIGLLGLLLAISANAQHVVVRGGVTTQSASPSILAEGRDAVDPMPNQPITFDQPIEASQVIVHSVSNSYGIGIAATDDGDLVTYVAHQSPYDHTKAMSNLAESISARLAVKEAARVERDTARQAKANAEAANSIPALRAEVARLAEIIEKMLERE